MASLFKGLFGKPNPESEINARIQAKMKQYQEDVIDVKRLLMLGTGDSGKSALFLQMQLGYGKTMTEKGRKKKRYLIRCNIVKAFHILINQHSSLIARNEVKQVSTSIAHSKIKVELLLSQPSLSQRSKGYESNSNVQTQMQNSKELKIKASQLIPAKSVSKSMEWNSNFEDDSKSQQMNVKNTPTNTQDDSHEMESKLNFNVNNGKDDNNQHNKKPANTDDSKLDTAKSCNDNSNSNSKNNTKNNTKNKPSVKNTGNGKKFGLPKFLPFLNKNSNSNNKNGNNNNNGNNKNGHTDLKLTTVSVTQDREIVRDESLVSQTMTATNDGSNHGGPRDPYLPRQPTIEENIHEPSMTEEKHNMGHSGNFSLYNDDGKEHSKDSVHHYKSAIEIVESEYHSRYHDIKTYQVMPAHLVKAIKFLWKDAGIQETWNCKQLFYIMYTLPYFVGRIDTISDKEYIPETEDILRTQSHTRGQSAARINVVELNQKFVFEIIDVGGQKVERQKWIQYMDSVSAVIFVSSLSSYRQVSYDTCENAFEESLNVFEDTINAKHLKGFEWILFLNKKDLFEESVDSMGFEDPLQEYNGDAKDKTEIIKYIKEQFQTRVAQPRKTRMHFHVTTAFNKKNVATVFNNVQRHVLRRNISQGGFEYYPS